MNKIVISILSGIIVFIVSYFLSKDMKDTTPMYVYILSMNFGLIFGILTHDVLWAKRNKLSSLTNGGLKSAIITGLTVMIIMFSAFLGAESLFATHSSGKLPIKLLLLSTGYVGVALGRLTKYIAIGKQNR